MGVAFGTIGSAGPHNAVTRNSEEAGLSIRLRAETVSNLEDATARIVIGRKSLRHTTRMLAVIRFVFPWPRQSARSALLIIAYACYIDGEVTQCT